MPNLVALGLMVSDKKRRFSKISNIFQFCCHGRAYEGIEFLKKKKKMKGTITG